VFVVSRTLTSLVRQVVFTVNNALWPHLTALEAIGDYGHLRMMHRLSALGSGALSVAFAAALWQVGDEVIAQWTGGRLAADVHLLHLLLVQVLLQGPWVASSVLPVAFNRPRVVAAATVTSSVVGLTVAALLMMKGFGAPAIPLGLIAGEALACYVLVPREACRLVRADYLPFAARQWGTLIVAAALAFPAAWALAELITGPALIRWGLVGVAALAASGLAVWLVGLQAGDRAMAVRAGRASLTRLRLMTAVQRA